MSDEVKDVKEKKVEDTEGLTSEQSAALDGMQPDFVLGNESEAKKAKPKSSESVVMVTMVLAGVFEALSVRLGDHWRLSPQETEAIANPAVMVLDKYMPDFESGPELALVAAMGMVVMPRLLQQKQLNNNDKNSDDKGEVIDVSESAAQPSE